MIMVNIADAKARLSEFVDAVERGEQVVICKRNQPVAELRAVAPARTEPRDLSPMFPGGTFMTDAFFEPMSQEDLDTWDGGDAVPVDRVAEGASPYSARKRSRRRKARR